MILPYLVHAAGGLRRAGWTTWRAGDDDGHFDLPLTGYRPRHLILILDGIDRALDATVSLDVGQGYADPFTATFPPAGRLVIRVDLHQMPEVRRLRIAPLAGPGTVRASAWATGLRWGAILLVRRLIGSRVRTGPTRVFTIREATIGVTAFGSGLERRTFRTVSGHFREVLALPKPGPAPHRAPGEGPLVSFLVPTFDTPTRYLDQLLRSVQAQAPGLAEIVFGDDGSSSAETRSWLAANRNTPGVTVVMGDRNAGIASATNAALAEATGPFVSMLDHDDGLAPGAVDAIARALSERPDAAFLYTDEVVATRDLAPRHYFLKPAFDPVLLSGVNYINHLSVYRTDRLRQIGGLRDGFQGSQDYDLLLRYLAGVDPRTVLHLPYPAYLWRRHEDSFSTANERTSVESARRALGLRYGRDGQPTPVEPALSKGLHRVRFDLVRTEWPTVSVVIPSRDGHDLLAPLLEGLTRGTDYPALEIVVADNGSTDERVLRLYETYRASRPGFVAEIVEEPFNFSRQINRGAGIATGEVVLFLNNDVEILEPAWLREMVSCLAYEGTGIVGARLLYPDRTIQHAGVIVGAGGLAGHWFEGRPETDPGPLGRLGVRQTMSAVTGAAMLVSRACLDAVGPFDEERFAVAYNDVDFCLRAGEQGFRTVWTPFATLIHHQSASRGSDRIAATMDRFRREQRNLRERHGTTGYCDRTSNPWYTRDRAVPALRALDRLPGPR